MGEERRGRTYERNRDGSGDRNEGSSRDGNGNGNGDRSRNGDLSGDGNVRRGWKGKGELWYSPHQEEVE